jgi:hypothetical protein
LKATWTNILTTGYNGGVVPRFTHIHKARHDIEGYLFHKIWD